MSRGLLKIYKPCLCTATRFQKMNRFSCYIWWNMLSFPSLVMFVSPVRVLSLIY